MSIRGISTTCLAAAWLGLAGCSNPGGGQVGCLGGGNTCIPPSTLTQNSVTTTNGYTNNTYSNGGVFGCTASPNPSQANPYQNVEVDVTITGTPSGDVFVTDDGNEDIPAGTTSFALDGYYNSSEQGTTVTRTVNLQDNAGNTTSCSFSVVIL